MRMPCEMGPMEFMECILPCWTHQPCESPYFNEEWHIYKVVDGKEASFESESWN